MKSYYELLKRLVCPPGTTKKYGHLPEHEKDKWKVDKNAEGQIGRGISDLDAVACKTLCDVKNRCKSFAYNEKERHCKLQSVYNPPVKTKEGEGTARDKDFSWCSVGNPKQPNFSMN